MITITAGNKEIRCRLIIFDKDGTLIDLRSLVLANAKARRDCIQKRAGSEISRLWERIVGVNVETGTIDVDGPIVSMSQKEEMRVAAFSFYLNGHPWNESMQMVETAYDEAERTLRPLYGATLLEGVPEKLSALKKSGLKLAIASNDKHRRIEESLEALGVLSLFDVITGADDVANGKPSPNMIERILEQTGARPEEAVIVGDSLCDMRMGKDAGVNACVAVLSGGGTREKLEPSADVVVSSINDLTVCEHSGLEKMI